MNRQDRLQRRRELYRRRMAAETPQERESRLARRRDRDRARRASLSREQRQCVLQERRERYLRQHQQAPVELRIDDENVVQMISSFHEDVASLEAVNCSVCQECFPTIKLSEAGHCIRCHSDSKIPKLFSDENNMNHTTRTFSKC